MASLDGLRAEELLAASDPLSDDPHLHGLRQALDLLPLPDQLLVAAAWIDAMPRRSLAAQVGLSCQALNKRLQELLTQLRQSAMANNAAMVV